MYQSGRTAALCRAPTLAAFPLSLPALFSPAALGFPGPAIQLHQPRGSGTIGSTLVPEASPDIKANPFLEVGEEVLARSWPFDSLHTTGCWSDHSASSLTIEQNKYWFLTQIFFLSIGSLVHNYCTFWTWHLPNSVCKPINPYSSR